jgi:hypothetical protein
MKAKFRDREKVWLKARVERTTLVGYIVTANGGPVYGYVDVRKLKRRRMKRAAAQGHH